jgi:hypothetical protein
MDPHKDPKYPIPMNFFFINHSLRQFCLFQDDVPVFEAIRSFMNGTGWKKEHNIVILTDKSVSAKIIKLLLGGKLEVDPFHNKEYKDITSTLQSLKPKKTLLDILTCRTVPVVYPLWDTLSNLTPKDVENNAIGEKALLNLDMLTGMEKLERNISNPDL